MVSIYMCNKNVIEVDVDDNITFMYISCIILYAVHLYKILINYIL